MCSLSFTTLVTFIILSTSIYTEAKSRGHHHSSHGLSGGSHSGHTSSGGGHSYPTSHGLSGNSHATSSSKIHYHYHYNPPRQINYTPVHGGAPQTYPVYMGTPPAYVYEYRDSGSVYGTLLTGLALYNLGYHSHSHIHHNYNPQPGEKCKFGVKKSNGDYEETLIKCDIITSFILEEDGNRINNTTTTTNTTFVTTTWSNVTTFTMTNEQPNMSSTAVAVNITYNLAPNGTLIPQVTSQNVTNDNGTITSMKDPIMVMSTTNTTSVTNAIDIKGKDIKVTPEMQCYMIRITQTSNMKRSVPCGVLQSYAEQSLHRNSANRHVATIALFAALLTVAAIY